MVLKQAFYGGGLNCALSNDILTTDNQQANLDSIVKGKSKIIFRFTDHNCITCVKAILPLLMDYASQIGKDNIILFVSQSNLKFIKLFCLDNDLKLSNLFSSV